MPDTALKPCPSCGSHRLETNERRHRNGHRHAFVICPKCGLRGPWGKTRVEAEAAWNDLPRAMRWTKEPPTKPGWYWWREAPRERTYVVEVFYGEQHINMQLICVRYAGTDDKVHYIVEFDGEWAGPISNIDK